MSDTSRAKSVAVHRRRAVNQQRGRLVRRAAGGRAGHRAPAAWPTIRPAARRPAIPAPVAPALRCGWKVSDFGSDVEQADFFVRRCQIERQAAQLLLQAWPSPRSAANLSTSRRATRSSRAGGQTSCAISSPGCTTSPPVRRAANVGGESPTTRARVAKVARATTGRSPDVRGMASQTKARHLRSIRAGFAPRHRATVRPTPANPGRDARERQRASRRCFRPEC